MDLLNSCTEFAIVMAVRDVTVALEVHLATTPVAPSLTGISSVESFIP